MGIIIGVVGIAIAGIKFIIFLVFVFLKWIKKRRVTVSQQDDDY